MSPREGDSPALTITSIGDAAVILRWGVRARVDPLRIATVDRSIRAARLRGVVDIVPAPASVLVRFDPGRAWIVDLETPLRRPAFASVACGGHARDRETMAATLHAAKRHGLRVGAHPSYPDRAHFGRVDTGIEPSELTESLRQQLSTLGARSPSRRVCG